MKVKKINNITLRINMKPPPITIGLLLFLLVQLIDLNCGISAISIDGLYRSDTDQVLILQQGNDNYEFVKLETPIHFYSLTYDHIYVSDLLIF